MSRRSSAPTPPRRTSRYSKTRRLILAQAPCRPRRTCLRSPLQTLGAAPPRPTRGCFRNVRPISVAVRSRRRSTLRKTKIQLLGRVQCHPRRKCFQASRRFSDGSLQQAAPRQVVEAKPAGTPKVKEVFCRPRWPILSSTCGCEKSGYQRSRSFGPSVRRRAHALQNLCLYRSTTTINVTFRAEINVVVNRLRVVASRW